MFKKSFIMIVLIAALVLTTTAVSASGPAAQINLKARAAALLAQKYGIPAESLRQVGRAPSVRYALQGLVVREFKFIDSQGGSYGIALNTAGQEVDTAALNAAEKQASEARFGKLDPQLRSALADAGPEALINVEIWLAMPEGQQADLPAKPAVNGGLNQVQLPSRDGIKRADAAAFNAPPQNFDTAALDAAEADAAAAEKARVAAVTAPFVQELRAAGVKARASEMAPLISASLPASMIRALAYRPDVDAIYPVSKPGSEMNIARKVVGANYVNGYGITGTGSNIAVVEFNGMVSGSNPYLAGVTRDNLYGCAVSSHVTGIAGIIRSTHPTYQGIAPDANLWVGCGNTDAQLQTMTSRANNWGAETYSINWFSGNNQYPGALDRYYDNMMYSYYDLVVKAAGNRGTIDGWITPPGLGYNTLTVGNFDDRGTVATADDVMNPTSSWRDPLSVHGDREKPEVVAPGTNIAATTTAYPWVGGIGSGTSFSGPMVAAMSGLLYQRNPALKVWPEATKAIIMATAIQNKEGATRLSEKDGAGGIWAAEADWLARNTTIYGRWGAQSWSCAMGTNYNLTNMYLYAGYKTRVVVVWDQNPNYAYYSTQPSADYDLQIWSPSNTLAGSSYLWDNTYEIAEFTPAVTGMYTIQLDKYRCNLTPSWLGWAWSQP
ncbi:MAG TPA: S8 family serine peptidase [Anaerolineales bacterium]